MIVRDARATDAKAWRAIVLEAATEASQIATWPEDVWSEADLVERIRVAKPDETAYLVAEGDGEVVGVLGLARGSRSALRHTADLGLTVARAHRGRGVGSALLAEAEARARAWGVHKLCLGVFSDNARAAALYRRLGYVQEGVRREHYLVGGRMRDEILMAKRLDEGAA